MDNLPPTLIPQPPPPLNTKWWIAGGLFLGVIVILLAFYIFRSTLFPPTPKITQKQHPTPTSPSQRANPIFETQSATVYGTITKINGSTLSVTNDRGLTGDFLIFSKVAIYTSDGTVKNKDGIAVASASSDLKTVEIGKQASLFLELINGEYQVVSISYFPPLPTPKREL